MSTVLLTENSSDLWETPRYLIETIESLWGKLNFDLAADGHNAKYPNYFGELDNSLVQDWRGKRGLLNPPYGKKGPGEWLRKCVETEQRRIRKTDCVVAIVKAATDSKWWHKYVMLATEIAFVEGRMIFIPPPDYAPPMDSKTGKRHFTGNNHGTALVYFGEQTDPDQICDGPIMRTISPKHVREFKLENYLHNCKEVA
ncbi:MAG TPA: DNA N-6-adenine-methyltransferase [Oculatellaceae cyanobacterium]